MQDSPEKLLRTARVISFLIGAACCTLWAWNAAPALAIQNPLPMSLSRPVPTPPGDALSQWFHGCTYVYLDVGSNVGVQIRKLFEPEKYPGAPVLEIYDEIFGKDRHKRTDVCAVGFEPNVHHTQYLKALEDSYTAKGWRVKIFTETAASTEDGTAEFFFDTWATPEQHEWGASLIPWQGGMKETPIEGAKGQKTTVRTLDLSNFVLKYIAGPLGAHGAARTVVMKMDIEGAEHLLLPHMIITGALCHIDVLFAEYHDWGAIITSTAKMTDTDFAAFFSEYVEAHDHHACKTRFRSLDDESYGSSDLPLPELLRRLLA